ncbi:MAG: LuxR family transcriptional regulator [Gammaproteobacteria bacterium]|nr:LuxR family transcriptional regulator [Gammaproteobacteria bacterium]
MTAILIADDHAVARAGYRRFLQGDAAVTTIGEAGNGPETLDMLDAHAWNLLLLDIHMWGNRTLDILGHVRTAYPVLRTLIVSGLPDELYARDVIRAGASGYLSKTSTEEDVVKAVRHILAGRRCVSDALASLLATDLEAPYTPLHARLSSREFQIFYKLASGISVTQIGVDLGLSAKTISTYRSRILEKMSLTSNANVTAYAMRNGIIR